MHYPTLGRLRCPHNPVRSLRDRDGGGIYRGTQNPARPPQDSNLVRVTVLDLIAAWKPWEWSASAWSALTFLVLVVAAGLTWRQVKETQTAREERSRPFVLLDFEIVGSVIVELHVRNIGATLARDVRFEFDKPLETTAASGDWNLADLSLFRDGIPYLAPGKVIKVLFDQFVTREEKGLPRAYTVIVTYADAKRTNHYREQIVLDLNTYVGTNGINQDGLHELHKQLKDLVKNIERWTDSRGLKIVTTDDQARWAKERRERLTQHEAAAERTDDDPS